MQSNTRYVNSLSNISIAWIWDICLMIKSVTIVQIILPHDLVKTYLIIWSWGLLKPRLHRAQMKRNAHENVTQSLLSVHIEHKNIAFCARKRCANNRACSIFSFENDAQMILIGRNQNVSNFKPIGIICASFARNFRTW
jgi:hypothetical protein